MKKLYASQDVKHIDRYAAKFLGINSFELMQRAAAAVYQYIQHESDVLIVTGVGNNAGDGFVIATLALKNKQNVQVWSLVAIDKLPTDAKKAAQIYCDDGGKIIYESPVEQFTCIVDAVFGTGLNRKVGGDFATAIGWINQQNCTVLAVDIPSGLDANTGVIQGCCVNADKTITILSHKIGLHTNCGKNQCGEVYLESLAVDNKIYDEVKSSCLLLNKRVLNHRTFKRKENTHKGSFGAVVVVGGHDAMFGALVLAGKSVLRSGAGLVEVVSNNAQASHISITYPDLIAATDINSSRLLSKSEVLAIGPGLGLNQESRDVLNYCLTQNKKMVIDADALTLIAQDYEFNGDAVLTPHPKEAASLLDVSIEKIQSDRVKYSLEISKKYNAIVVLKGSGTVIAQPNGMTYICPYGYSGMATAGMGDVLTGIIAGLIAQGFSTLDAANTGVVWHALAAQACHKGNCLVASDVIEKLPEIVK
jgi:NAD(P)H-hydrate epimerase